MSQYPSPFGAYGRAGTGVDYESRADAVTVGQFFNMVYAWMCVGLALTAVVGWYVANTPSLLNAIYGSRGGYFMIGIAAIGIAWFVQAQAGRLTVGVSTFLFLLYAAVIGALIAGIFKIYESRTLIAAFVLTGGTFGAMSVYGFVTKRDLSRIGAILVMAALGLVIASLVNFWLANDTFSWFITYGILAVFIGITAWETQQLRYMAGQLAHDREMATRYAIVGSLVLYISFINIFLAILRILGDRR